LPHWWGLFLPEVIMTEQRVVLFIDYQNCYRATRAVFYDHETAQPKYGQINPLAVGELLIDKSPWPRKLHEVRVYRGLPSQHRDPIGYAATRRQIAAWEQDERVKVFSRPLQYPDGWPDYSQPGEKPREKGIDVALAVDFATMAARNQYDVGIVFSLDTDLMPALEYVAECQRAWGKPRAEVVAWDVAGHRRSRLSTSASKIYCHWLKEEDRDVVEDLVKYA
jgi:uncharacterized LabA/DUF88 family protein